MFIGRFNEIKKLVDTFNIAGQHSVVYGNRRVGKTALVTQAASFSKCVFVSFECLKSSLENNQRLLEQAFYEEGVFPTQLSFPSIIDLFKYVDSLKQHIIVLVDEYPYLYYKNDKNEVDSIFQLILDKYASHLNLVFSGSHIGMMKDLLKQTNPIFGRVKTVIHLLELNYLDASAFYPHLSHYDKVAFYAVFGGSPYVLRQIDETKSLKDNICALYLNPTSSVFLHISEGYTTDLTTKDSANQIFEAIGNRKVRHNRIEELIGYAHNGLLSKQLNVLMEMEFIDKNAPINKIGDTKKYTYFIKNNALRFYFTYIYGRLNALMKIGAEAFYDRYIKDSLITFISFRFEDVVKTYLSMLASSGFLKNVYDIGSYYYDDPLTKTNGEFDIAIKNKNGYDIIEAKFTKNKVDSQIVNQEIAQIKSIKEIKVKNYGFASINGFKDLDKPLKYQITGQDLFFEE